MSGSATARRRGRGAQPEGPRATFRQLLPSSSSTSAPSSWSPCSASSRGDVARAGRCSWVRSSRRCSPTPGIGILVWLLVGFVVVSSVISGFQHYLLQRTGTAVVYSSRRKLIARILHLPTSEFDARRTGDLVSRVGTDTTLLYAVLTQGLADAVGSAVLFLGALIAMLVIDPILLLLIVVVIGISVAVVVLLSGRIRTASTAQQEKVGELASGVERAVGSIRTIRASGATERETTAVSELASDAYGIGVRIAKISSMVVPRLRHRLCAVAARRPRRGRIPRGRRSHHDRLADLVHHVPVPARDAAATTFGAITSVNQPSGHSDASRRCSTCPPSRRTMRRSPRRCPVRRQHRMRRRSNSATCASTTRRTSWPRVRPPPRRHGICSPTRTWSRQRMPHTGRPGPRSAARGLLRRAARLPRRPGRPQRAGKSTILSLIERSTTHGRIDPPARPRRAHLPARRAPRPTSATSNRMRRRWPAHSPRTCGSPPPTRRTPTANECCAP